MHELDDFSRHNFVPQFSSPARSARSGSDDDVTVSSGMSEASLTGTPDGGASPRLDDVYVSVEEERTHWEARVKQAAAAAAPFLCGTPSADEEHPLAASGTLTGSDNSPLASPCKREAQPLETASPDIVEPPREAPCEEVPELVAHQAENEVQHYEEEAYSCEEQDEEVYITAAEAFGDMDLKEAMPRYKIRLEREKEAAMERNEPRIAPRRVHEQRGPMELHSHYSEMERARDAALAENLPRVPAQRLQFEEQPSLDSMLRPHYSDMERARDEALAENKPRVPAQKLQFEEQPSLDSVLRPHYSEMERARDAALAKNEPRRAPRRVFEEQPPLESMLKKTFSRVEREKMAFAGIMPAVSPPRKSRLQMEKEAAARMAAQRKAKAEQSSAVAAQAAALVQLQA